MHAAKSPGCLPACRFAHAEYKTVLGLSDQQIRGCDRRGRYPGYNPNIVENSTTSTSILMVADPLYVTTTQYG
jgi:hypothetical protein